VFFIWKLRGIVVSLILGTFIGEAIATVETFVVVPRMQPPPAEFYLQYPSFVMASGLFWAFLWAIGTVLGIPFGLRLRKQRRSN
jgi:hypothetical protein